MENQKVKQKNQSIGIVIICSLIILIGLVAYDIISKSNIPYVYYINHNRLELSYQGAKDTLVSEIDKHIQTCAPNSCLNGLAIVNACDEYDIDLVFVLAQGYIEGHYATKGLSKKTNSVFNVGAYDGKGSKYMISYSHPDHSIEPYLKLLKSDYLIDNKTELDLMDKYVNYNGKRYASDKDYEFKLISRYQYIIGNTNINNLYNNYKKYKILTDK